MTSAPPKVFISYSHDTVEHQERVLGLADRLKADGTSLGSGIEEGTGVGKMVIAQLARSARALAGGIEPWSARPCRPSCFVN